MAVVTSVCPCVGRYAVECLGSGLALPPRTQCSLMLLTCCILHSALMDCLIVPLQEKLDDWRKVAAQLEKDHAKGERVQPHFQLTVYGCVTVPCAEVLTPICVGCALTGRDDLVAL